MRSEKEMLSLIEEIALEDEYPGSLFRRIQGESKCYQRFISGLRCGIHRGNNQAIPRKQGMDYVEIVLYRKSGHSTDGRVQK